MGDPKKTKKKYIRPRKPWNKTRLDEEKKTKETYGLKNKRELWTMERILKNKRQNARKLLALELEKRIKREKELTESIKKIGILKENATLDDILGLKIEEFLERRLQTIVWRKGLANTPKQARQFIVHGHIAINGKKTTRPSYMVKADEENGIKYYKKELKLKQEKPKTAKELKKEEEKSKEKEYFEEIEKTESTKEEKDKKVKEKITEKKDEVKKEIIKESPKEKIEEKKEAEIKKETSKEKEETKKDKEKSEEKKEIKKEVKEKKEEKDAKEEQKKDEPKEGAKK